MPGPQIKIPTSRSSLDSQTVQPTATTRCSNTFFSPHELLVTTSSGLLRWKANGTIVQSFISKDAGVIAAAAIPSSSHTPKLEMIAVADSQIIQLVHVEDGAVYESYGLKGNEVIWPTHHNSLNGI